MNDPSLDLALLPNLCFLGPRFLTLTGFFRTWLQLHFSSGNNFRLDNWRQRTWTDDVRTTSLVIEDALLYNPKQTEYRPAVMIRRNSVKGINIGIDSGRAMGSLSPSGVQQHTDLWQGSYTFFCLAKLPGEVDQLAYEVWSCLNGYKDVIRKKFSLVRIAVAEIGAQGILKESAGQQWAVPITIAYVVQENWELRQEVPVLRSTDMRVDV